MKIGRGVSELWRVENRPLPLTWPMAYTTACTTVQAVMIKHIATKVSADALYSVRIFSFGKVYTSFAGNMFYMVSYKMITCAVLLESFKNFETLICKRRTLAEHFELAQT